MEVTVQRHVPAALLPSKERPVSVEQEAGWAPGQAFIVEKILCDLCGCMYVSVCRTLLWKKWSEVEEDSLVAELQWEDVVK
jgi:hypothetical protein